MTTSNHRPFTYPDGRIDIPSPGERDGARQVHRLRDRQVHRGRARQAVVRRHAVRDHRRSLRRGCGQDAAARRRLSHPADLLRAEDRQARRSSGRSPARSTCRPRCSRCSAIAVRTISSAATCSPPAAARRARSSAITRTGYYKDDTLTVLSPHRKVSAFAVDPNTLDSSRGPWTRSSRARPSPITRPRKVLSSSARWHCRRPRQNKTRGGCAGSAPRGGGKPCTTR